jgi:hypothetical protein
MAGSFDVVKPFESGASDHLKVSWNLCKQGSGGCTQLDDRPQEKKDPCGSTAAARALLDTAWNQRQMKVHELEQHWKDLQKTNETMLDNLEAWRAAIAICAIEDTGAKVAQSVVTDLGGKATEITEVVGRMVTGDLTVNFQGKLSDVGDILENGAQLINAARGPGNPKLMAEKLADCAALPADLRKAAKTFVDAYAEMPGRMRRVKTDINDVRSRDQKYWDQWQQYYRACLEDAKCRGKSSSDCIPPPEQPTGPMPGQTTR